MNDYFLKNNHNLHNKLFMAYCNDCEAIRPVGGDYLSYDGRDCLGDNFKMNSSPEQCTECRTDDFIKISYDDMSELKSVYEERTAETIIEGISKGLEDMNYQVFIIKNFQKLQINGKNLVSRRK